MSTAGSIAPEQAEPSTSDIQKIFSPAKIKKLVKKRNELIRKQEEYATREVDFDNPDREERKDKEEKVIHKTLLNIEKLLYEQGELVDVTEDTHRLFDKNRQKYQLMIKGTGNELLDQRLSEALKTKLEDEPSYVMSCALDPAKMMDICLKVKKQELDATGNSSIPNKSTGPFDLLMAKVAGLVKKAVVDYRYGDHNSLLNVYVTKEEEANLNEVEELHEPMGMPKDLTQIVCEGEDNAHDDIKNAGDISTASGSDSGDATDYDEVYEGEDEDPSGENVEIDDVMDILETTSESRDNGIEKESKTMVTNECSPVNDIPPPAPLGSEDSSSIEVLPNVVKNGCDYSEIVLSSGPTRHSASDMDTISIRMAPIKELSIKSSAAVVIHNGLNKDSLQSADEKGDFIEESDDEEEQPIKPEWLKGKTSEELVACFNAHIENEDLQVIYATEYEEFEPRIEKFKMERCADWAAQIEGWLVEFPDLAEVEKPSLPEIEAEVKKSTPSPATGPRNGKRERTRSRQRSERLRVKEVEEAAKEVKRMRPAEFSPTSEIITID